MPTTSNFGWTTPADTDLVKDGAAAIRTLGNGIDTSLVDLKGGTTGQVLSKASNTDLDFTWTAGGDITEVQAGVGISVASGTGPIPVITNSSTDLITTAGDLLYGTAADTVARLGIGTAGQVLKVNSGATAPEWAAIGGTVKQIVTFTSGTNTTTTGGPVDTALTANITPSSASSKIIVMAGFPYCGFSTTNNSATSFDMGFRVLRGATVIQENSLGGYQIYPSATQVKEYYTNANFITVDSPNTTSSTTYKVQIKSGQSTATANSNYGASTVLQSLVLMEI